MNRQDFQELARLRIEEAQTLLSQGKYDGAYYLAGYSVECALKACIAKKTREFDFPPKDKVIKQYYSRNLPELIKAAGLGQELEDEKKRDPQFDQNWATVRPDNTEDLQAGWTEASRYLRWTQKQAESLVNAIADPAHGVLQWVERHW